MVESTAKVKKRHINVARYEKIASSILGEIAPKRNEGTYIDAAAVIISQLQSNPEDPLGFLNYRPKLKKNEILREVASKFFPAVGRRDLMEKYQLK